MIKQVIIIRKDLRMRRGKEIAQGAHASMKWLTQRMKRPMHMVDDEKWTYPREYSVRFSKPEEDWIKGLFTKITLQVNSEEELVVIHNAAQEAGIISEIIEDAGMTEFAGVKTKTAVAIGPDRAEKIDPITAHLKLY